LPRSVVIDSRAMTPQRGERAAQDPSLPESDPTAPVDDDGHPGDFDVPAEADQEYQDL
jgi:hypothetical protein